MSRQRLFALVAVIALTSCMSTEDASTTSTTAQSLGIPNAGFIPYPAKEADLDGDGELELVRLWDGTLVDLMAADAFGFCAPWWRETGRDDEFIENDDYLKYLIDQMSKVIGENCASTSIDLPEMPWKAIAPGEDEDPSTALLWAWQRTQEYDCNVDTATGEKTVVQGPSLTASDLKSRWEAYDLVSVVSPAFPALDTGHPVVAVWQAKREAAMELGVAGMNLCMASRLREQMLSADVLIASGSDQRELLEVIRERAQVALLQFALIGRAFTDSGLSGKTPNEAGQALPALRAYAEWIADPANSAQDRETVLAQDYAEALSILLDSTDELAELLGRAAAARTGLDELGGFVNELPGGVETSDSPTWGEASWRGRLLSLNYGGDPLGRPSSWEEPPTSGGILGGFSYVNPEWHWTTGPNPFFWQSRGTLLPRVETEIGAPEVRALIGLARQADALYLAYESGGSYSYDYDASGEFIYQAVEAELQQRDCAAQDPTVTCKVYYADEPDDVPPIEQYGEHLLWKRFRIAPEHAMTLARVLGEAHGPVQGAVRPALIFSGQEETVGSPPQLKTDPGAELWLHLDSELALAPPPMSTVASGFDGLTGILIPPGPMTWDVLPQLQGFVLRRRALHRLRDPDTDDPDFGASNRTARYMGVVPVLAAVRDALHYDLATLSGTPGQAYHQHGEDMLRAITAAIGPVSYSLRPELVPDTVSGTDVAGCRPQFESTCPTLVQNFGTNGVRFRVDVIWPESGDDLQVVLVDADTLVAEGWPNAATAELRYVATAALSDTFVSPSGFSQDALDDLPHDDVDVLPTPVAGYQRGSAFVEWSAAGAAWNSVEFDKIILIRSGTSPDFEYAVLADGIGSGMVDAIVNAEMGSVGPAVIYNADASYGSMGGDLNAAAGRAIAGQAGNWAKPAYDGFGLPSDWLPPTNPDLFGGNDGEDSVAYFLRSARTAADEATAAVRYALESVIAEKADAQKLQASRERSEGVRLIQRAALCGDDYESGCALGAANYVPVLSTGTCDTDHCQSLAQAASTKVPASGFSLLAPIAETLSNANPALAHGYGSGALSTIGVDQFNAVRKLEGDFAEAVSRIAAQGEWVTAAEGRRNSILVQFDQQNAIWDEQQELLRERKNYLCDEGIDFAKASTVSWSESLNYAGDCDAGDAFLSAVSGTLLETACGVYEKGSISTTRTLGPLFAAWQQCDLARLDYTEAVPPLGPNENDYNAAESEWTARQLDADAAVATALTMLDTNVGQVNRTIAEAAKVIADARLADARAKLDAAVEQSGFASQLLLSRRYHHYDFWRARALLEDARRLASTARRAIESRFVVDLSKMQSDEPFVKAPALWADEIYEYDLDAPSSVGLSTTPDSGGDGLYPNKLSDYVRNLENFVRGYSVRRPTATAFADGEVVTLPGPEVKETIGSGADAATTLADGSNGWMFQCVDEGPWITNPAGSRGRSALDYDFSEGVPPFANKGFSGSLDLTLIGGALGDVQPAIDGNAVNMTTGSLASLPNEIAESENITVAAWVNLRTYATFSRVFVAKNYHAGTYSSPWYSVNLSGLDTGKVRAAFGHGTTYSTHTSTNSLPLNQWTHVAMTYDGQTVSLYINGELDSSHGYTTPIEWGEHGEWWIGGRGPTSNDRPDGWVGRASVDTTAYTPERIRALYEKGLAETVPSLVWQFEESEEPFVSTGASDPVSLDVTAGEPVPLQSSPVGTPAIDFDGSSSLVSAPTSLGESPNVTMSAWTYVRSTEGTAVRFLTKNYHVSGWSTPFLSVGLSENANGYHGSINIAGELKSLLALGTFVPRNQWSHIATTYDGKTIRLYLNGKSLGTWSSPTGGPVDWGNHGPWTVGSNATTGQNLDGLIADVRIEPRARSDEDIWALYNRGPSGGCYYDDACVGNLDCCPDRKEASPLRTMCDGDPPVRARVQFHLDPWGRQNDYYANPPYVDRHNVRWGRMAVNLVGVGIRDCSKAPDPTGCYAESFLRYNMRHAGPSWVTNYDGEWRAYGVPTAKVEGGKALAIEEWLDPIVNGWNETYVSNVQRHEFRERPLDGTYELELEVTPDVQLDRIERVQVLTETNYWVREEQ